MISAICSRQTPSVFQLLAVVVGMIQAGPLRLKEHHEFILQPNPEDIQGREKHVDQQEQQEGGAG